MGLDDTFEFEEAEYAARMARESDQELKKREVIKMRQHLSTSFKVGAGIGGAFFTGGLSLLGSAYAARQYNIAERKLAIVRKELEKRKIKLHEMRKRDFFIPISSCCVGMGLAWGVDELVSMGTNTGAVGVGVEHLADPSVVNNFVSEPGDFVNGAIAGAHEQVSEVYQDIDAMDVQNTASTPETMQQHLADSTVWVPAPSSQEAVGFHQGTFLSYTSTSSISCPDWLLLIISRIL